VYIKQPGFTENKIKREATERQIAKHTQSVRWSVVAEAEHVLMLV